MCIPSGLLGGDPVRTRNVEQITRGCISSLSRARPSIIAPVPISRDEAVRELASTPPLCDIHHSQLPTTSHSLVALEKHWHEEARGLVELG